MSYCYVSLFVNILIFYCYYRLTPNRFLGCSLVQIHFNFLGARNSNYIKIFFKRMKRSENTTTLLSYSTVQLCFLLSALPKWPVCHASGSVPRRKCHRPAPPRTPIWDSSHHKEVLRHHMCTFAFFCEVTQTPPPANRAGWWVLMRKKCKHFWGFFCNSGLGLFESPLFLASHEEEGGGRSVPTTPLQVSAPGISFWYELICSMFLCSNLSLLSSPLLQKNVVSVLWK